MNPSPEGDRELDALRHLIASTIQFDLHRKPGPPLVELIRSSLSLEAAAIFDADMEEIYQAGSWWPDVENQIRNIHVFERGRDDKETGMMERVLRVGELPVGALLLRGDASGATVDAIAGLVAITFDRYHSLANETRIESARRAEQLRTTVLDHLAHAYKTPLTAIRVASSGLVETGSFTAAQSSLLALIEEQSEVLNQLTTRLLQTARLEAHDLTLHSERMNVLALVEEAVATVGEPLAGIKVKIDVTPEDLSVYGDRSLLRAMLTQFVDNAAKYADAGSTVTIGAEEQKGGIVLSVHNSGPAIPVEEQEHVFERYFRSSSASGSAPGTGIGLSIARRAAQAHGGDVWVTSNMDDGTTFYASLPAEAQELRAS
ncbi:MAG TPA: ATP-binding protein [Acidobacteriaceae bacterium]|nr:ATP-binding protein [Acidobacteriaceae bacterium]